MSSDITFQPDRNQRCAPVGVLWLETITNHHLSHLIAITIVSATNSDNIKNDDEANDDNISRTELDYHANMVVIGIHDTIIINTTRTEEVNLSTMVYEALQEVLFFDASLLHMLLYTYKTCILVVSNLLHFTTMNNNIILSYITR